MPQMFIGRRRLNTVANALLSLLGLLATAIKADLPEDTYHIRFEMMRYEELLQAHTKQKQNYRPGPHNLPALMPMIRLIMERLELIGTLLEHLIGRAAQHRKVFLMLLVLTALEFGLTSLDST